MQGASPLSPARHRASGGRLPNGWRRKVPIVYGPGRHPPSDSIFLYFLDPDETTIEFSFGMEEFPEHNARPPRMLAAGLETIDYWGGFPDPRFAAKGVIETVG